MNFAAQLDSSATRIRPQTTSDFSKQRRRALQRIDIELSRRNFKTALSLLRHFQRQSDGLRAFGTTKQVPKKLSSLDEFVINGVDLFYLKPTVDLITDSIKSCIHCSSQEQVSSEGFEADLSNQSNESSYTYEDYRFLCIHHEAGHFLIGYLLGILPKAYKIPSMAEFQKDRFASGSVDLAGFDSLQVRTNKVSLVCIVLFALMPTMLFNGML